MEFWIWFTTNMLPDVQGAFFVFLISLSLVYLSGRFFGILNQYWDRNLLAMISIYGFTYLYVYLYEPIPETILEWVWIVFYKASIAIILYTVVGMKFFVRIDSLLDRKIGED